MRAMRVYVGVYMVCWLKRESREALTAGAATLGGVLLAVASPALCLPAAAAPPLGHALRDGTGEEMFPS